MQLVEIRIQPYNKSRWRYQPYGLDVKQIQRVVFFALSIDLCIQYLFCHCRFSTKPNTSDYSSKDFSDQRHAYYDFHISHFGSQSHRTWFRTWPLQTRDNGKTDIYTCTWARWTLKPLAFNWPASFSVRHAGCASLAFIQKKKKKGGAPPFPRERKLLLSFLFMCLVLLFSPVFLFFLLCLPSFSFLLSLFNLVWFFPFFIMLCSRPFSFKCNNQETLLSWSQQALNSHTVSQGWSLSVLNVSSGWPS